MNFQPKYLSAGANRHSSAADWSPDGIIAFGSSTNIAIWRPSATPPRGVTSLLKGHDDTVQAIRFIPRMPAANVSEPTYFVSGAAGTDGSLRLWASSTSTTGHHDHHKDPVFECVQAISSAHDGAVTCISATCRPGRPADSGTEPGYSSRFPRLVATGGSDPDIKIWIFQSGTLTLLQAIPVNFIPLSLAISPLGGGETAGDAFVLCAAGSCNHIQVYTATATATATESTSPDDSGSTPLSPPPPLSMSFSKQATLTGHEDWIRSLDIIAESDDAGSGGDLLLASASGDKYIRLWRVHADADPTVSREAAKSGPSTEAYLPGRKPTNKAHRLRCGGRRFSVAFEALLLGHEDWIYTARWRRFPPPSPSPAVDGHPERADKPTLRILSASADNSLAVWEADAASGIWVTAARLGEISREKGATTATGSMGGFWTGLWGPDGREVVCVTRTGSWRRWVMDGEGGDGGDGHAGEVWRREGGITGHTGCVTGISWSRSGDYLLSTSQDQTTRLHAAWRASSPESWHEMSRPQIHGYDLNCVDSLGDSQFVSGADEKLMRVFREPKAVAGLLRRVAGISLPAAQQDPSADAALPDAADMPVLGLSNKAVDTTAPDRPAANGDDDAAAITSAAPDAAPAMHAAMLDTARPPTEDVVSRYTLWPETEKLYGHGFEISCLACSHDGSLVASACRASSANHAVIRLFETARWTELRPPLAAHSLTVARVRFSADDRFLLSVGRDRAWAVFEGGGGGGSKFGLRQMMNKAHSRMLLDGAWAPLVPGRQGVFVTAGRDKQVLVWALDEKLDGDGKEQAEIGEEKKEGTFQCVTKIPAENSVTAVDCLPRVHNGAVVLAMATEAGWMAVHNLSTETLAVISSLVLDRQ